MRLALLDVGHGNTTVLHEGKSAVVVDCPPGRSLIAYLRSAGVSEVTDLIISHADKDHCGGVPQLSRSGIRIRRLWMNNDQVNDTAAYEGARLVCQQARDAGSPLDRGHPHSDIEPLEWGEASIEFLSPHHEDLMRAPARRNQTSAMVRISIGGEGIALLTADMEFKTYQALNDGTRDYSAQWLVAPHHGGLTGTEDQSVQFVDALIQRTESTHIFFSFGRARSEGRPNASIMSRLVDMSTTRPLVACCSQLSTQCAEVHPLSGEQPGFQHQTSEGLRDLPVRTCAGTVVLDSESDFVWHRRQAHDAFVRDIPHRLCNNLEALSNETRDGDN